MNCIFILAAFLIPTIIAWDCSAHMTILQITLTELNGTLREKLVTVLNKMSSGVSKLSTLEAACFHHDMEAASFTGLSLWNAYEFPDYVGIDPKDSRFTPPLMSSLDGIVISVSLL